MLYKKLISKHSEREKRVHDKWIERKGLSVEVKAVENGYNKNYDFFNNDVRTLDYSDDRTGTLSSAYLSKLIFINNEFQPISISLEQQDNELGEVDNHNELYCYIGGVLVPRYSILKFTDFNTSFRVEEVKKKRPYSKVYKYLLVRN